MVHVYKPFYCRETNSVSLLNAHASYVMQLRLNLSIDIGQSDRNIKADSEPPYVADCGGGCETASGAREKRDLSSESARGELNERASVRGPSD